ncbi:bifunctional demethylmenaquinone methyltransferase/2-methoxy-6-polyprenyl-1,4-benzoquinol methylase UbiE [Desulfobacter curvatus]|uniref:bifunctional demethylmenaquinone methyltransferase/2-methoxy-6-polyprenyl-1,4-benzoquinol methylase UbiE n=1 Tax=Desulfobacter curvatus TaxID=2290 RepID=UPI000380DC67|nr:bifunctional demethylmenaquinone methyltransferase/2-methoxy-6-polyprenyl-1,4-benzoquinol methylase UbiE [Desulfobacter curvatus]
MNQELDFVKEMFDKIAPQYDFLNRLLSMRRDVYWRKEMVKAAKLESDAAVLDAACGTCDVGLEVSRVLKGKVLITGLDFSFGMLALGKKKLNRPPGRAIALVNGDALNLPVKNQQFDAGFMAFGIRNIMNRIGAMKEFHRTLKPGGRIIILELTTPPKGLMRRLYLLYFQKILPLIGSFFSKHGNAYAYLPESVLKFPDPVSFASQMKAAGFKEIRFKEMTLGIVTLFVGIKL